MLDYTIKINYDYIKDNKMNEGLEKEIKFTSIYEKLNIIDIINIVESKLNKNEYLNYIY
jgi:capsule polysaccharide export protein KpsE/RkpR